MEAMPGTRRAFGRGGCPVRGPAGIPATTDRDHSGPRLPHGKAVAKGFRLPAATITSHLTEARNLMPPRSLEELEERLSVDYNVRTPPVGCAHCSPSGAVSAGERRDGGDPGNSLVAAADDRGLLSRGSADVDQERRRPVHGDRDDAGDLPVGHPPGAGPGVGEPVRVDVTGLLDGPGLI